MSNRCPICDATKAQLDIVEAFTLGAGLGERNGLEMLRVNLLCGTHRMAHVLAMASLRMKVDALDAPEPSSNPEDSKR